MNHTHFVIVIAAVIGFGCSQSTPIVTWSFSASGKILSHPVVHQNTVFFGSDDSSFYAVDIPSGTQAWRYRTRSRIRSTAVIEKDIAYVTSGNDVYALDKNTGREIWSFLNPNTSGAEPIDNWDYHFGKPALHGPTLYAGLGDGFVYGFDAATGAQTTRIATADTVPVRSTLLIDESTLYFGDWNGRVYAYDLETGEQLWTTKTFDERPYPTFGPVNTTLTISGDLLFFGSRNPELQVLDKRTGEKQWSYLEAEGGWISGDPLIQDDTLYIGGSDNHEMFAFNARTGQRYWVYEFLYNTFSRPFIYQDVLLFTIGDAYTGWGTSPGRGYLYAVNKVDGNLKTLAAIGGNMHTSPVLQGSLLFVGSEDNSLYAIDLDAFLSTPFSPESMGYDAVETMRLEPNPFDAEAEIAYTVNYPATIAVTITDLSDSTIAVLFSGEQTAGEHSIRWDGNDAAGNGVEDGYYFVKVSSKEYYRTTFIQKKRSE